jgi:hypothetical protein
LLSSGVLRIDKVTGLIRRLSRRAFISRVAALAAGPSIALVPHDAHAQQAAASRRIGVLLVGSLPEGKEAQGFRQPAR